MKNIIIISAPSGSGKTTICRALQQRNEAIHFSVSCTTREQRNGEVDGVDYTFLTNEAFKKGIENNEFVEWEQIHGDYYYGTLKTTIEAAIKGEYYLLLELDVKGASPTRTKEAFGSPTPNTNWVRELPNAQL